MKRKLITLTLAILLAFTGTASALGWSTSGGTGGSPKTLTINPGAVYACPSGQTWHMRSYTYDFGFFDSTGNTVFKLYPSNTTGYHLRQYVGVEHDEVTRTWDTGDNRARKFTVSYYYLSSVGAATFRVFCQ